MQIKIFSIPVLENNEVTEELNKFLRSHTIIDVERQLISDRQTPIWTFCIRYKAGEIESQIKSKVDYREVLDEETFKVFSKYRAGRKQIAQDKGVPVYAIFTNEELANIAKLETFDIASLKKIDGIGVKKAEKYGQLILDLYNSQTQ